MSINVSVQMSVVGERQVHASIHDPFASLSVECGTNSVAIVYRSVEEIAKHATALFQLAKDFGAAITLSTGYCPGTAPLSTCGCSVPGSVAITPSGACS